MLPLEPGACSACIVHAHALGPREDERNLYRSCSVAAAAFEHNQATQHTFAYCSTLLLLIERAEWELKRAL